MSAIRCLIGPATKSKILVLLAGTIGITVGIGAELPPECRDGVRAGALPFGEINLEFLHETDQGAGQDSKG